jgi:hypothetical protein
MTPKQQKNIVKMLVDQGIKAERKRAINAIYAAFAICLTDHWEWSKEDIKKLLAQTEEQFEAVLGKFITVDEFEEWAREYGILEDDKNDRKLEGQTT